MPGTRRGWVKSHSLKAAIPQGCVVSFGCMGDSHNMWHFLAPFLGRDTRLDSEGGAASSRGEHFLRCLPLARRKWWVPNKAASSDCSALAAGKACRLSPNPPNCTATAMCAHRAGCCWGVLPSHAIPSRASALPLRGSHTSRPLGGCKVAANPSAWLLSPSLCHTQLLCSEALVGRMASQVQGGG